MNASVVGKRVRVKVTTRRKLSRSLMAAISRGDVAAVRSVLQAGIDPAVPDRHGMTPLWLASVEGEAEIVELLLKAGVPPNEQSEYGPGRRKGLPLCAAAAYGCLDVIRVLLEFGADPNMREPDGSAPLDQAARILAMARSDKDRAIGTAVADLLIAAGARSTAPATDAVAPE